MFGAPGFDERQKFCHPWSVDDRIRFLTIRSSVVLIIVFWIPKSSGGSELELIVLL